MFSRKVDVLGYILHTHEAKHIQWKKTILMGIGADASYVTELWTKTANHMPMYNIWLCRQFRKVPWLWSLQHTSLMLLQPPALDLHAIERVWPHWWVGGQDKRLSWYVLLSFADLYSQGHVTSFQTSASGGPALISRNIGWKLLMCPRI